MLSSNVLYAGCQWLMLIVVARLCPPEMLGRFALALAISAPVCMLFGMHLKAIQAVDAQQAFTFYEYFQLRIVTTVAAFIAIVVIAAIARYPLTLTSIIVVTGLSKCLDAISEVVHGHLQRQEEMTLVARSLSYKAVLSLSLFAAAIVITREVFWAVAGLALSSALVLLLYDLPVCGRTLAESDSQGSWTERTAFTKHLWTRGNRRVLYRLALSAFPLGCVQMLVSLNTNIPRYSVEHYLGTHELGIFAAMSYFIVPGQTIVSAWGQSVSPRLARYFIHREYSSFWALMMQTLGFGVVLGLAGVLCAVIGGHRLLLTLYPAEYARHIDVFIIMMITAAVSYVGWFLGYGLTAIGIFRAQVPLLVLTTLVTFITCNLMIPYGGLRAAAAAMTVGMGVQVIGSAVMLFRSLRTGRAEASTQTESESACCHQES